MKSCGLVRKDRKSTVRLCVRGQRSIAPDDDEPSEEWFISLPPGSRPSPLTLGLRILNDYSAFVSRYQRIVYLFIFLNTTENQKNHKISCLSKKNFLIRELVERQTSVRRRRCDKNNEISHMLESGEAACEGGGRVALALEKREADPRTTCFLLDKQRHLV